MDEAAARTLLSRLADTEPPPARIDLDAAMAAGRRRRRWRRLRAGGSVLLAAGAAVAVIVAPLTGPAQRPGHQAAGGPAAAGQFSVLAPYASFGWLPPGFTEGAAGGTTPRTSPEELLLVAAGHDASIELLAYPAGICHLSKRVLACSAYNTASPVGSRAPDVRGHQAYWLKGAALAWEYSPGAWAQLNWTDATLPWPPTGTVRTAVLRTAAGVRYGQTTPLRFPYWISGLPKAWHIAEVEYTLPAGRPVPLWLHLGDRPGDSVGLPRADNVQVYATRAADRSWSCAPGQHVTVDGVTAILYASPTAAREQVICVPDWHGLRVEVVLSARRDAPAPDPTGPHGVLEYARMLHPLGPDAANWTTRPLR